MNHLEFTPYTSLKTTKNVERQVTSPSYTRILQLNQKLSNLQIDNEQSNLKKDTFQTKLKSLDDYINRQLQKETEQFNNIKQDLIKLSTVIGQQQVILEDIEQASFKEIKTFQTDFVKQQSQERTLQKENDLKLLKAFQDSCQNLKQQWKKDVRVRQDIESRYKNQLQSQVNNLQNSITTQIKVRQQKNESLILSLSSVLSKISNSLNIEKKFREQNHLKMLKSLEQLNTSMITDIRQQQSIREKADELLYKLLQQTCLKVESCIRRKIY